MYLLVTVEIRSVGGRLVDDDFRWFEAVGRERRHLGSTPVGLVQVRLHQREFLVKTGTTTQKIVIPSGVFLMGCFINRRAEFPVIDEVAVRFRQRVSRSM